MLAFGIELWTDAIWFKSVGYDQVFWTRVGVQVGLFLARAGHRPRGPPRQPLARRPARAPVDGRGRHDPGWIDRLNEAAANADRSRQRGPWDPWGGRGAVRAAVPSPSTPVDMPDLVPLGRIAIVVVIVLTALGVAGSIAGDLADDPALAARRPVRSVRAPSSRTRSSAATSRSTCSTCRSSASSRRRRAACWSPRCSSSARATCSPAMAGSPVFNTRVRVHLGVLAALFLMVVALGYQLDKLDLVHSTRGIATGVCYTDQHAQFLAYDLLTAVSAITAALLLGGAFARVLWPVGITVAFWFIASIAIGRVYPEIVQRITVVPNQQTLEAPYIANNIAMTRLAFDLEHVGRAAVCRRPAADRRRASTQDQDTFDNARLWDYRPLGDALNQLQTIRQYYAFPDVDIDRYQYGDEPQAGDAVRPRDRARQEPERHGLGQPAPRLHPRHRASRWSR